MVLRKYILYACPYFVLFLLLFLYRVYGHSFIEYWFNLGYISIIGHNFTLAGKDTCPLAHYYDKSDTFVVFFLWWTIITYTVFLFILLSKKGLIKKLSWLFLIILFSFGFIELYLRYDFFTSKTHLAKTIAWGMLRDDTYGWSLSKNSKGELISPVFGDIKVETNSSGFRSEEYELTKKPGKKRVVLLGDSYMFGWGLNQEDTIYSFLRSNLSNTEFLNFAVPGYSPDQELILLQDEALKYFPDLIVLLYGGNDINYLTRNFTESLYQAKPRFILDSSGNLVKIPAPRVTSFNMDIRRNIRNYDIWLGEKFYWYDFLRGYIQGWNIRHSGRLYKQSMVLAQAIYQEMDRTAENIGADFFIVFTPFYNDKTIVELSEYLRDKDIDSLVSDFSFSNGCQGNFFIGDLHYNKDGARKTGQLILDHIAENYIGFE